LRSRSVSVFVVPALRRDPSPLACVAKQSLGYIVQTRIRAVWVPAPYAQLRARRGRQLNMSPRSRDTLRPSFANSFAPSKKRGRREDRVRAAPAVSRAKANKKTHTSIQVQRKQSGLPCAMVLQLISCSPRRDLGLFVTVIPKKRELPKNLTPAIGASGPHDFAVRVSAVRRAAPSRPSHPTARFVTCATPLSSGGTVIEVKVICLRDQP
jgi:hypothetical protein